jgi:hypothetical protein
MNLYNREMSIFSIDRNSYKHKSKFGNPLVGLAHGIALAQGLVTASPEKKEPTEQTVNTALVNKTASNGLKIDRI